jgi:hypothetical protein
MLFKISYKTLFVLCSEMPIWRRRVTEDLILISLLEMTLRSLLGT